MALKLLKVSMTFEVKADPRDELSIKEEIFDYLTTGIEYDELEWTLEENEDEEVVEED
jgi:hypothetical protein